jgi:hypothetical protein
MRSYNSLNSRILNTSIKNSNTLATTFQTNYLANSGNNNSGNNNSGNNNSGNNTNVDLSSYALKTIVDGSFNYIYTNYALANGVYTKSYIDTSFNSLYTQLNVLTNDAPETLNTLAEISTAIKGDASFGIVVYEKIAFSDLSINELRIKNTTQDTSVNLLTTSNSIQDTSINLIITKNTVQDTSINLLTTSNSIQDTSINLLTANSSVRDPSMNILATYNVTQDTSINLIITKNTEQDTSINLLTTSNSTQDSSINRIYNLDVSFNGNIRLGFGNKSIAINKDISTNFALDISGSTNIVGNLSVTKNPSDTNYSYFDLSSVNLSIFNTIEKFTTVTFNSTSMTLNYSLGSIFYTTATANFAALLITNVPTTLNRSITVTLISAQSGTFYFTGTAVSVNGTSISYIKQDGTAFAVPSASRTMVVYQFNIIFASSTPTIIGTMAGFS